MATLKRAALEALAGFLQPFMPDLPGLQVRVGDADVEDVIAFPCVTLVPAKFSFTPFQADEVATQGDQTLISVGDQEGPIEIRCGALYPAQREALEDAVQQAMWSDEMSPGNVNLHLGETEVGGISWPGSTCVAAFDLEDAEWHEETVFTQPRYSYVNLQCTVSALVSRDYPTINTLVLALTNDVDSVTPTHEDVTIDENGNIAPSA